MGNVSEPSLLQSYLRVFCLFTFWVLFFSFSRHPQFLVLPRSSPSSSRIHGSSSPHLQSATNALLFHSSSPHGFSAHHGHRPSSRSLRRIYAPASSLRFPISSPRSSTTLDRAPSVICVFVYLIKCLRAKKPRSLCRPGHFGSVLRSIKFSARFLESP